MLPSVPSELFSAFRNFFLGSDCPSAKNEICSVAPFSWTICKENWKGIR